jgi:exodeoxyribonuclease VII large subunit
LGQKQAVKGQITLEGESGEVRIAFGYDPALVEVVRALPRRRFSREDKAWFVPRESVGEALRALAEAGFEVAPEVLALAERERARRLRAVQLRSALRAEDGLEGESGEDASLSPAELNTRARVLLRQGFAAPVWVVGEVLGWRDAPGGRASFFELVEKDPRSAVQRARVRAVIFPEEHQRLTQKLARMGEPLAMEDGLQVRLLGRVDLHERSGSFQLRVEDIDPHHTLGQLVQRRELILEQLDELGVASLNLQVPMPAAPLRVGLITSLGSDACEDFLHELRASGYGFQVEVYDARMQGRALEGTVLRALGALARRRDLDVVALVRGGGSRAELSHFDTLPLALALCEHPLPIICGIGHQLDQCIVDDVTRSYKTPTAAAAALVERAREVLGALDVAALGLERGLARVVGEAREALREEARRLSGASSRGTVGARHQLELMGVRLRRGAHERLRQSRRALGREWARLPRAVERRLGAERRRLDGLAAGLSPLRVQRRLERRRGELDELQRRIARESARRLGQRAAMLEELQGRLGAQSLRALARQGRALEQWEARLGALDPANVLRRGFAVVTGADGAVVRRAEEVAPGARLRVRLSQGALQVQAEELGDE